MGGSGSARDSTGKGGSAKPGNASVGSVGSAGRPGTGGRGMARDGGAKTGSAKPGRAGNEGRDGSAGKPGTGGKGSANASVMAGSAQAIAGHVVLK